MQNRKKNFWGGDTAPPQTSPLVGRRTPPPHILPPSSPSAPRPNCQYLFSVILGPANTSHPILPMPPMGRISWTLWPFHIVLAMLTIANPHVRLSVCPSHTDILSKRRKPGSRCFHRQIATDSSFLRDKLQSDIRKEHAKRGRQMRVG